VFLRALRGKKSLPDVANSTLKIKHKKLLFLYLAPISYELFPISYFVSLPLQKVGVIA